VIVRHNVKNADSNEKMRQLISDASSWQGSTQKLQPYVPDR
jgi:hypothetical protein